MYCLDCGSKGPDFQAEGAYSMAERTWLECHAQHDVVAEFLNPTDPTSIWRGKPPLFYGAGSSSAGIVRHLADGSLPEWLTRGI